MAGRDPFYAVSGAVETEMKKLSVKVAEWSAALQSCNTSSDPSFKSLHEQLGSEFSRVAEFCSKLVTSVVYVEANRAKFAHVDDVELTKRKNLVQSLEQELQRMRGTYQGREARSKMEADARRELAAKSASASAAALADTAKPNAYTMANEEHMKSHKQQQQQMVRQQDEVLVKMSGSIDRVADIAATIHTELKDQETILEDLDSEVSAAQSRLDSAIKGIEKLLKTKDKCQLITIAALTLTFVIVAVIALYMITSPY